MDRSYDHLLKRAEQRFGIIGNPPLPVVISKACQTLMLNSNMQFKSLREEEASVSDHDQRHRRRAGRFLNLFPCTSRLSLVLVALDPLAEDDGVRARSSAKQDTCAADGENKLPSLTQNI
jgi:hypothetical protein